MPKVIGFTATGTYPSHTDLCVASLYFICDEIIVINGGYDVDNVDLGDTIPIERDKKLLKEMDIDNKITQIKPSWEAATPIHKGMKLINPEKDEGGRSRNLTHGVQAAIRRGADLVIKIDADECLDLRTIDREKILALYPNISIGKSPKITNQGHVLGFRLGMYECHGDFYHFNGMPSWAAEDSNDGPSSNDAPQIYHPYPTDYYGGGGAPAVKSHIIPKQDFHAFHVRSVVPHGVDPFEYFYKRYWYHTYAPWLSGETRPSNLKNLDDIKKHAEKRAKAAVEELKNIDSYHTLGSVDDPKAPKSIPKLMMKLDKETSLQFYLQLNL